MDAAGPDRPVGAFRLLQHRLRLLVPIVAMVSGQSFTAFLHPPGMKHTRLHDASRPARGKLAQGFVGRSVPALGLPAADRRRRR